MRAIPYIIYNGNCEAAFNYYAKVIGGKIEAMVTFESAPAEMNTPPEWKTKILHANIQIGDSVVMGSDAPPGRYEAPAGISVSLDLKGASEAERIFAALAENGSVRMPIQQTFFAVRFGMLVDQFGVPWMINCDEA